MSGRAAGFSLLLMAGDSPLRVLVVGGGVAALEAALALRVLAEGRVTVELLALESDFTYRPLAVAAPFRVGEVRRFSLSALVKEAGATHAGAGSQHSTHG